MPTAITSKRIGHHLTRLRTDRALSLREVERRAGISRVQIASIEKAQTPNPGIMTICTLLKCYGVSLAQFGRGAEK